MIADLGAWALGLCLIVSGCYWLRVQKTVPAIGQSLAWAQGSIAAGAAVIGLAVRHPGAAQWFGLVVAICAFIAAAAMISGLLKAMPGPATVSRQYTNTLPALAATVAILTCILLTLFAPPSLEGAALGLLAVFATVAARLALTIASRDRHRVGAFGSADYGLQAVGYAGLGVALLSPAASRIEMGLLAGFLILLSTGWTLTRRVTRHLELIKRESQAAGLPDQQQIDRFLGDYFRHKQPDGVILLKFAIAGLEHSELNQDSTARGLLFKDVGSVLQRNFRADDFVAAATDRQFLVACPGLQPDIAQALAERACQAVKRTQFQDRDGQVVPVTLLVGTSSICESLPDCERGWQQADGELWETQHAAARA